MHSLSHWTNAVYSSVVLNWYNRPIWGRIQWHPLSPTPTTKKMLVNCAVIYSQFSTNMFIYFLYKLCIYSNVYIVNIIVYVFSYQVFHKWIISVLWKIKNTIVRSAAWKWIKVKSSLRSGSKALGNLGRVSGQNCVTQLGILVSDEVL
jgi:hypothetical protein